MSGLNKLEKRIIEISYKKGLSHLSSCLTSVRLIDHIYLIKKHDEPFILDNGHAGLALYVVLEKFWFSDAEKLFEKHGVHPNRDKEDRIDFSTGSLGQGLPAAVGMAIANPDKLVYVLTSDGAMAEGSNWEALRIAGELRLENLRITVVCNGTSAYGKVDVTMLDTRLQMFYPTLAAYVNLFSLPDYMQGVDGHYKVLNKKEYEEIMKL